MAVRFDDEEDDDDVNGSVDEYVSDDDDAPATLSKNKESIESITDDSDWDRWSEVVTTSEKDDDMRWVDGNQWMICIFLIVFKYSSLAWLLLLLLLLLLLFSFM